MPTFPKRARGPRGSTYWKMDQTGWFIQNPVSMAARQTANNIADIALFNQIPEYPDDNIPVVVMPSMPTLLPGSAPQAPFNKNSPSQSTLADLFTAQANATTKAAQTARKGTNESGVNRG